jgi:hypothetical protein
MMSLFALFGGVLMCKGKSEPGSTDDASAMPAARRRTVTESQPERGGESPSAEPEDGGVFSKFRKR